MTIALEAPSHRAQINGDSNGSHEHELESLRAEIARLTLELKTISAERDYLQNASLINVDKTEQLHRTVSARAPLIDFSKDVGQSRASLVNDPRIGRPKRILIIGGGPAGLASLHELLSPFNRPEGTTLNDYHIQLYERRAEVGGVWYFEPENDIAKGWHHGGAGWHSPPNGTIQKKPNETLNGDGAGDLESSNEKHARETSNGVEHIRSRQSSQASQDFCYLKQPNAPRWPSPAYEGLVGNVLPPLLEFSAKSIPKPSGGLFPSATETHNYLLEFAEPFRSYIKTCQEVTKIHPVFHSDNGSDRPPTWVVSSTDWSVEGNGATRIEEFDAVIVAAGAYDVPYYPEVPGLAPLLKQHSPLVMHAKSYPGPRPFVNRRNRIVVVGNGNSANDIAAHLAPLNSDGPLYRSIRTPSRFAYLLDTRIKDVVPIKDIALNETAETLTLTLQDGTVLRDITNLIFASGYRYDFDWLQAPNPASPSSTVSASLHGAVPNLFHGTIHAASPTLAFVGLAAGSIPMPFAEIQARVIARTLHGVLALPSAPSGAGADQNPLLASFTARAKALELDPADPERWRELHMVRGPEERAMTKALLELLEDHSEVGASVGLFRWDERREGILAGMRVVKEGELRRLRDARIAAGGVDGGVGGVLSKGLVATSGTSGNEGSKHFKRGMSVGL